MTEGRIKVMHRSCGAFNKVAAESFDGAMVLLIARACDIDRPEEFVRDQSSCQGLTSSRV